MSDPADRPYASRGGLKLTAALDAFGLEPAGLTCADLGANVGGFTDCLLRRGAARVYAVDTGYGTLAWTLRKNPRVIVMERTNAMHFTLPEPVDLLTIDVGWTPQHRILPNAMRLLHTNGRIVTLIKPHYESDPAALRDGVLAPDAARRALSAIAGRMSAAGANVLAMTPSPIAGGKGNLEFLAMLTRAE